jgi:hypothetical protein
MTPKLGVRETGSSSSPSLPEPYTQDYHLEVAPSSYDTDGTRALKLSFDGVGEIDFICTGTLSAAPTVEATVRGRKVFLETPLEIVTKKLVYRGSHIQPRDMFDIAAVAMVRDPNELIAGLRPYTDECRIALAATERFRAVPVHVGSYPQAAK